LPSLSSGAEITGRIYSPDGTLWLTTPKIKTQKGAGFGRSSASAGWGWAEPGRWSVGKYRVEVAVGFRTIAEGSFEITAARVTAQSLKFFESGNDAGRVTYSRYSSRFSQMSRFIWFELTLRGPAGNQDIPLTVKYYKPDGSVLRTFDVTA